jgi:HEAT repeat protein
MNSDTSVLSAAWREHLLTSLQSPSVGERKKALEFLSLQTDTQIQGEESFLPLVVENLVHENPEVRYFARKARNVLETAGGNAEKQPNSTVESDEANGKLSTREILLRKIRLGSRYVAFECMERLTESRDPLLAEPLLEFLDTENDPYKISYLVKRIARIPDPRVPGAIEARLVHSDLRVVANAIEGLWELEVPALKPKLAEFAGSADNRIRANAVRALHKYAPEEAERHLEDMLESGSVALQDSALFLLKILHPKNVGKLVDMALNSPFAGIRLRALEIPTIPCARPESLPAAGRQSSGGRLSDFSGFALSIFIGGSFFYSFAHSFTATLVMVVCSLLSFVFARKSEQPFFMKLGLSLAFLAIIDEPRHSLLAVPFLFVIWVGISRDSSLFSFSRSQFFACMFGFFAILLANANFSKYQFLADGVVSLNTYFGKPRAVVDLLSRQKSSFFTTLFFVVSIVTLVIAHLDRWIAKETPTERRVRYYLIAILGGSLAILAAQFSNGFGLMALLSTNGLTEPGQIFKLLSE